MSRKGGVHMNTYSVKNVVPKDFGDCVQRSRNENGLSQEKLSEKTEITRNTVSNVEMGKDTKLSTAVAIAKVLEISLDEIFDLRCYGDLSSEEFELMRIFRRFNDKGKSELIDLANVIYKHHSER